MIGNIVVDLTNAPALLGKPEQVDRQHFLVGERRPGVIALALGECFDAAGAFADEQVDLNERKVAIHVAKGGF